MLKEEVTEEDIAEVSAGPVSRQPSMKVKRSL